MDNRRVSQAYRDRSREKVLPYPSRGGLLTKMKRYFSAGSASNSSAQKQSRSTTQPPPQPANQSVLAAQSSFIAPANNSFVEGDVTTNRILSSFFQEKGDRPLTQIEYEGVMSLLDKSRANITMPVEETPQAEKHEETNNTIEARHNQTFAPYSQKVLRNTSMLDANLTSIATPEYKPVYHTFNDTSRSNVSLKRVYQFSGLPSPYRTRIRAPNLNARRAKRLASAASQTSVVPDTSLQSVAQKPLSNAANSLLSILDNAHTEEPSQLDTSKPLHNPFARNKRRNPVSLEPAAKRAAVLGASDITKTVLHSKATELEEKRDAMEIDDVESEKEKKKKSDVNEPEKNNEKESAKEHVKDDKMNAQPAFGFQFGKVAPKSTSDLLFGNTQGVSSTINKEEQKINGDKTTSLFGTNSQQEPAKEAPKFTFGKKESPVKASLFSAEKSDANGFSGFSFGSKPEQAPTFGKTDDKPKPPVFNFGAAAETKKNEQTEEAKKSEPAKPAFSFGAKPLAESKQDNKPPFSFGAKPVEKDLDKPSFSFGKPAEKTQEKPTFSFGKPAEKNDKPAFSFGKPVDNTQDKPAFSFGAPKKAEDSNTEKNNEELKPSFSFGSKPADSKPALVFGALSEKPDEKTEPKPLFSFGVVKSPLNISQAKPKEDKPLFSFGAKADEKPKEPISFGFGKKDDKPAFSFGAAENKPSENKPTNLFGAKAEQPKEAATAEKPAFSFAKSTDKPAFSFGVTTESKGDKPTFGFGAAPQTKTDKPAFTFGLKPEENGAKNPQETKAGNATGKPVFSFGKQTTSKPENSTSTPFSFGSSQTTQPSVFGAQTSQKVSQGANGNGVHSDNPFVFPKVESKVGEVDDAKVEQYKSLFKF